MWPPRCLQVPVEKTVQLGHMVQAADFLADENAMAQACQDLSIRMFGHVKGVGAPASKKRKTNSRASMAHKLIQERRDANEKVKAVPSDVM